MHLHRSSQSTVLGIVKSPSRGLCSGALERSLRGILGVKIIAHMALNLKSVDLFLAAA